MLLEFRLSENICQVVVSACQFSFQVSILELVGLHYTNYSRIPLLADIDAQVIFRLAHRFYLLVFKQILHVAVFCVVWVFQKVRVTENRMKI